MTCTPSQLPHYLNLNACWLNNGNTFHRVCVCVGGGGGGGGGRERVLQMYTHAPSKHAQKVHSMH